MSVDVMAAGSGGLFAGSTGGSGGGAGGGGAPPPGGGGSSRYKAPPDYDWDHPDEAEQTEIEDGVKVYYCRFCGDRIEGRRANLTRHHRRFHDRKHRSRSEWQVDVKSGKEHRVRQARKTAGPSRARKTRMAAHDQSVGFPHHPNLRYNQANQAQQRPQLQAAQLQQPIVQQRPEQVSQELPRHQMGPQEQFRRPNQLPPQQQRLLPPQQLLQPEEFLQPNPLPLQEHLPPHQPLAPQLSPPTEELQPAERFEPYPLAPLEQALQQSQPTAMDFSPTTTHLTAPSPTEASPVARNQDTPRGIDPQLIDPDLVEYSLAAPPLGQDFDRFINFLKNFVFKR
ncbi:hypothetical protein B0T21DRAFT_353376 [Apiosordaria backusii]|uniref:Uncharacterized protein n=1 Tax=Apiosordaria backusii TaxID=314023 RepID=A0AA40DGR6_9PEZI|nr:hypothetical protein B0T21DRAFT_353376 [Apiosordaria backusii]